MEEVSITQHNAWVKFMQLPLMLPLVLCTMSHPGRTEEINNSDRNNDLLGLDHSSPLICSTISQHEKWFLNSPFSSSSPFCLHLEPNSCT
jgi:hypothetical protein